MMLAELAISIHEERTRKWNSDRNAMAQRRAAAGLRADGTPRLAASFARSGRELARALRRNPGREATSEGSAR